MPESCVYFIECADAGLIKIGITTDLPKRLRVLQQGFPYELKVIATLPGEGLRKEQQLHERFAHLRVRGEWFKQETDLLEFVNSITVEEPEKHDKVPEYHVQVQYCDGRCVVLDADDCEEIAMLLGSSKRVLLIGEGTWTKP